jgi:hypothetical protein
LEKTSSCEKSHAAFRSRAKVKNMLLIAVDLVCKLIQKPARYNRENTV